MIKEVVDDGETWMGRLEMLCAKFAHYAVSADISSYTQEEAWGLYVHLRRLADG